MIRLQRLNVVKLVGSEERAAALEAKGFTRLIESKPMPKTLDQMTVAELEAYAAERGIDLAELKTKAEKLARIEEVEARRVEDQKDEQEGGN